MEKEIVSDIVMHVLRDYCESNGIDVELNERISLVGGNRLVDSIGLVNIIVDLETAFQNQGYEILLVSESAMSRRKSPFLTIETLCDFILEQLNELKA